jgi:AraC-like DNA-binding protein
VFIIVIAYLINSRNLEKYGLAGLMVAICVGYYFMQRAAHLSAEMQDSLQRERYSVSRLSGQNVAEIREKLTRVMAEEKIFTDFELTMPKLAARLNLKPHQLSEYLNKHLDKKFNDFINEYRVEEAKKLLGEDTEKNIMRISLAAGFNSKSAFNLIFRKYVGLSPSNFRERHLLVAKHN